MTTITVAWDAALTDFDHYARAQGNAATTRRTRREHLSRAARTLGVTSPWEVTADELLTWFAAQEWATETRRGHRATHVKFWAWAVRQGYLTTSPAAGLPRVRPSPPKPRPTPDRSYRVALMSADSRVRLMMRLAGEVGLRRAEVAQIHSRDVIEDLIGWALVVHGKGGKERLAPLPDDLAAEIRRAEAGWLFPGDDHGHLSPRWVGKLVTLALPEGWTMHSLRHRFATKAYAADHDLFAVQELLGHASPATTRCYVHVDRSRLRDAMQAAA